MLVDCNFTLTHHAHRERDDIACGTVSAFMRCLASFSQIFSKKFHVIGILLIPICTNPKLNETKTKTVSVFIPLKNSD